MTSLQQITDSILAVEIGRVWSRALLIDRVDGAHRFVAQGEAPSTLRAPHANLLLGLRAAIRTVEARTGRTLLDEAGELLIPEQTEGRGVDLFVCTMSGTEPLKVAVGGLAMQGSAASARQGALSRPSTITHLFALDAPGGRWGNPNGAAGVVEQLLQSPPDAIVLVGNGGTMAAPELKELVEAIELAQALSEDGSAIVWAASRDLNRATLLQPSDLPTLLASTEGASEERAPQPAARLMEALYRENRLKQLPGVEILERWGAADVISSAEAWTRVAQYLAIRNKQRVLAVEVGGSSAMLAAAFPTGATQSLVRADLGLDQGADGFLERVGWEQVVSWVPGDSTPDELQNLWATLALHPAQQPPTQDALYLLQGAARASLRLLMDEARPTWEAPYPGLTAPFDVILGGGRALRQAPRPEQALAILLDALQPVGISHLLRDRGGIVPAVGALAGTAPQAAADLVEMQRFESLGVVIAPIGEVRPGGEMLHVRLTHEGSTTEGVIEQGQSYRFPTVGRTQLELHPLKNIDAGLGPNVPITLTREGDSVGFVIDARGRPLPLSEKLEERRALAAEWMRYVGA